MARKHNNGFGTVNETIMNNKVSDDIMAKVESYKTYLGGNPAIPDIFDTPFLSVITNNTFKEIKERVKEFGSMDDVESDNPKDVLSELLSRCAEMERPYRDELEKICYNYIIDAFDVPSDSVMLETKLVDRVEDNDTPVEPNDSDFNLNFDDMEKADEFKFEIAKRKIFNTLCEGMAFRMANDIDTYAEKIKHINNELPDLYKKILAINSYLLYTENEPEITDKDKKQIGNVSVSFGDDDELVNIKAEGTVFPILLLETAKGFAELFVSHGLPKDKETAMAVIAKTDYIKGEPWTMRFGEPLWNLFSNMFNDITTDEIPYLLKRVAEMSGDDFNWFMKEVFAQTKKGRHLMSIISKKAKQDKEYNSFLNKMSKMKDNNGIITDEYIRPDEL
jgi:hypothetical protein